jgi:acetyl esterase/lipase
MASVRSWFIKQFVRLRIKHLLMPGVPVKKVRGRTNYLASYGWYPFLVKRERFRIGEVPVAAYTPKGIEPRGTVLFLHGGGFCFGSIKMYADLAARLSAAAQARVVLPEYRLAPEHRYPAAHDDCRSVYEHLLAQGVKPSEFALVGDSAGGGLVLATVTSARDRGLPLPAALGLISPWIDLVCNGPTYVTNAARDPMLPVEVMSRCAAQYAGDVDVRDPQLSPLYADLSGLPPTLIQVGTEEILQSDSTRISEAARAAGVDVTLRTYDAMWHVWQLFAWAVPEGKMAIREMGEFVRQPWGTKSETGNG